MTRLIIPIIVALLVSGPAWGKSYTTYANVSCGKYLGAYSSMKLTGDMGLVGSPKSVEFAGYISGYITAYNQFGDNEKGNVLGPMSMNDAHRWIASWCRDYPQFKLLDALNAPVRMVSNNQSIPTNKHTHRVF
jgi:hypothetical protein